MIRPKTNSMRSSDRLSPPNKCREFFFKNILLFATITGGVVGIVIGLSLRSCHLGPQAITFIAYPGELFMRILKMMMLPLVISSLIAGSASLNAKMNGKIAVRTLIYFVLTSMFNAFLGVCLVSLVHPGDSKMKTTFDNPVADTSKQISMIDSFLDLGRNVFPDNLFQASFQQSHTVYVLNNNLNVNNGSETDLHSIKRELRMRSGTNMLGIVFFCLIFGGVLGAIGEKGKPVANFFGIIFEVVMKIVTGIMFLTPVGVGSLIAGKILGVKDIATVMSQVGLFIVTYSVGVIFYQLIIMQLIYFVIIRKNPYHFYWNLMEAMLTASATASTAAALPITFRCMEEKLKVDSRITRFILPIACNINMDGTALYVSIASVFIAQLNNMDLGIGGLCTVMFTSTIASLSGASVPSAALVILLIVMSAIDAPMKDATLLFAIDWFVDRIRTTNNMLGDCYAAAVVENLSKNELAKTYEAADAIEAEVEALPLKQMENDILCKNNELEHERIFRRVP